MRVMHDDRQFTDADFHQLNIEEPIRVSVTFGELDDSLKNLDACGKERDGLTVDRRHGERARADDAWLIGLIRAENRRYRARRERRDRNAPRLNRGKARKSGPIRQTPGGPGGLEPPTKRL